MLIQENLLLHLVHLIKRKHKIKKIYNNQNIQVQENYVRKKKVPKFIMNKMQK
jgi:hypothetical protein